MLNSNRIKIIAGALGLVGIAALCVLAARSGLFTVREVKVELASKFSPVSVAEIQALAEIPTGRTNLFELDLAPIQKRVLSHAWVKSATVHQEVPSTIRIHVVAREPVAQLVSGSDLYYLENDGHVFSGGGTSYPKMLPVISGWPRADSSGLAEVSRFMTDWLNLALPEGVRLSSLDQDLRLGLRASLIIPLSVNKVTRPVLELGMNLDEAWNVPEENLKATIAYIQKKQWAVHRLWVGDGKKIVVKRLPSQ